jgi:hypothetical protein
MIPVSSVRLHRYGNVELAQLACKIGKGGES